MLRGKPVIINFWASWCPPCTDELPFFERVRRIRRSRHAPDLISNEEPGIASGIWNANTWICRCSRIVTGRDLRGIPVAANTRRRSCWTPPARSVHFRRRFVVERAQTAVQHALAALLAIARPIKYSHSDGRLNRLEFRCSRRQDKPLAPLDKRKAYILATVVYEYIATAEPVASQTLTQKYQLGVSWPRCATRWPSWKRAATWFSRTRLPAACRRIPATGLRRPADAARGAQRRKTGTASVKNCARPAANWMKLSRARRACSDVFRKPGFRDETQ